MLLSPTIRYAPYARGRYTTTPNLVPLEDDPGLIRLDEGFFRHRKNKLEAVHSHPERHVLFDDLDPNTAGAAVELIAGRLVEEYPEHFRRDGEVLDCGLTQERLVLAPDARAFADLCLQIPEDIALVRHTPERGDWNAALHVCAPSRWAPEEKIGRSFVATHAPVPGMDKTQRAADRLVEVLLRRGPFVRFNWGIAFDDRLNLHSALPAPMFDGERLWVRVERQVLWPLPSVAAALFSIRVYLYDAREALEQEALAAALKGMSPESRAYKGLADSWDAVLSWLMASP